MPDIINKVLNTVPNSEVVSHQESINHTPKSNCEWKTFLGTEGERGISRCYPIDNERIEVLKKYGTDYVKYNIHGEPDFSPFVEAQVKISNMTNVRQNNNFPSADAKLAETKWARDRGLIDEKAVKAFRTEHKLTWHETRDGVTMQLIPQDVHEKFPHLGGVSIMSHIINEDGVTVGEVIIKANQSIVEFQEMINNTTYVAKGFISEQTGRFMSENFKRINAAGVDEAVNSAMFAAVFSTAINVHSVIKDEKSGKEATKEILYDTASAAVLGYATGAVMENFNIERGDAALLVNGTVQISKQVFSYVNGEIDEQQLFNNVAETTANLVAAHVGKTLGGCAGGFAGAMVGFYIGGPAGAKIGIEIGEQVGKIIGELITTAICSEVISTIKATKEFEKQNQKYISLYHRAEREIKASNERLISIIETENNELKAIIQQGFEEIYNGINDNSYDLITSGLQKIGSKFGLSEEELKKDNVTRENLFKNRNKVIVIGEGE